MTTAGGTPTLIVSLGHSVIILSVLSLLKRAGEGLRHALKVTTMLGRNSDNTSYMMVPCCSKAKNIRIISKALIQYVHVSKVAG